MKIAVYLFVFLASFYTGHSSAAAKQPASEFDRQVLAEIKELEQKQRQNPFDADLHFILGTDYWTLNDEKKAIEHYQRALLLEPDYHSVHWNLSVIYNRRGDGANAITHMKKAEEIFLKKENSISLAKAREKLAEFFVKYNYKPEDFEERRGLLWRLFN